MRVLVLTLLFLLLCGCSTQPQITVEPVPVMCQVPAGLLVEEPMPKAPRGDYTQRDVALYINDLHEWGDRAVKRVTAIDQWVSDNCG